MRNKDRSRDVAVFYLLAEQGDNFLYHMVREPLIEMCFRVAQSSNSTSE
jgi:hypothetical protein